MAVTKSTLSLGPLLFNWETDKARDFYFRIADEAPVEIVYLGEVVCSKRQPFHTRYMPEVIERLQKAGKQVILSTLALIINDREVTYTKQIMDMADDFIIEANDISAVSMLKGKPHAIGPFINTYNKLTLEYFKKNGANHISLPFELPAESLRALAENAAAEIEVQIFGRLPLAISARCYHARSQNKTKDSCEYVCNQDNNGLTIDTMDGQPFLAINGLQTMSNSYCNLAFEIPELQKMGINSFRLSPHDTDMVAVANIYRKTIDGVIDCLDAEEALENLLVGVEFSNGFYYGKPGLERVAI